MNRTIIQTLYGRWQSSQRVNIMVWGLLAVVLNQSVSLLSMALLNAPETPWPWTWVTLLNSIDCAAPLLSVLLLGWLGLGGYYCRQGGMVRCVGMAMLASLVGFIFANSFSLIVFNLWQGVQISPLPWLTYALFTTLPEHSAMQHRFLISFTASCSAMFALPLCVFMLRLKTPNDTALDDARFASALDIQKANLYSDQGIIVGRAFGKTLRLPGFEGVLVNAPTGGGKTTCIAIPNCLEWNGSLIANDLKGELFKKTHGHRQRVLGNACYEFKPTDAHKKTARFNPFFYVSEHKDVRIRDVQLIAETLIPAERIDGGFWYTSSRQVFVMLALYFLDTEGMATLQGIHDLSKREDFISWLEYTVQEKRVQEVVFYQNAHSLLGADKDKTQKNILTDFHSRMALFSDPLVCYATSGNEFDLRQLRKEKISVYLHIPDSDKERLKPIVTLFWAVCMDVLTQEEPDIKTEPYPVLALLDEFGSMAKLNPLKNGMSFFRSYRIRPLLIVQYFGQILSTYGQYDARGFLNAKVKIAFALTDMDDAKFISTALGNTTVKLKSYSTSSGGQRNQGSQSHTVNVQSRPLMSPHEILQLKQDECIIVQEGARPIKAKKCYWYQQSRYRAWLPEWVRVT